SRRPVRRRTLPKRSRDRRRAAIWPPWKTSSPRSAPPPRTWCRSSWPWPARRSPAAPPGGRCQRPSRPSSTAWRSAEILDRAGDRVLTSDPSRAPGQAMVFFNYSTMQMTAKVVYYGPGLCGKTTNLQYIYGHTANDSRGEMVSLETETDRTLFFDLLPIDVGNIGGFSTRIQLYTVPGQVFYNTTRKLVLKGVDGVVFVADSQRPMLQANIDSFHNLEENLAEMQLTVDSIPIVL